MSEFQVSKFVGGDGAAVVLLQVSVLDRWNVAAGAVGKVPDEKSRDFNAVCSAVAPAVISRHDRDVLIMDDCSWVTAVVEWAGKIALVQSYGHDGEITDLLSETSDAAAKSETMFECIDGRVRLMPTAIFADDPAYPFHEFDLAPGTYRVVQMDHPDAMIVRLEKIE